MGQYLHYFFFSALLGPTQRHSSIPFEALLIYLSDLDLPIEFVPTVLHF